MLDRPGGHSGANERRRNELRALRTLKREATPLLAERSWALPRVADDGCAFKALRPHPPCWTDRGVIGRVHEGITGVTGR